MRKKARSKISSLEFSFSKELDKLSGKNLFPKQLKKANETLKKYKLPSV
jgi:hypothetical protein